MRRLRKRFLSVALLAATMSALAVGTFAQAWCCSREDACPIQPVSDACASSTECGGAACAEPPSAADAATAPDSADDPAADPADAPCVPTPERCPLLVTAPAEPARSRPADPAPDDISFIGPHAPLLTIDVFEILAPEPSARPRAPVVPDYLRLRHFLI